MKIQLRIRAIVPIATVLMCIGIAALVSSCYEDDFDFAMRMELFPVQVFIPEEGIPEPGGGGIITIGAKTETSIQLLWEQAEDIETPQEYLEYRLYLSEFNNIAAPDDAEEKGTVVEDWTPDLTAAAAYGLVAGRAYYFNVVVRDGEGNSAAYLTVHTMTQSDAIYLFSAGLYQGNLTTMTTSSPRADIDSYCISAKENIYPELPCLTVRAFISISPSDSIAAMPANFLVPTDRKIISTTGTELAPNWAGLFDGAINETLAKAGVAVNFWWSGSEANGEAAAAKSVVPAMTNCNGWKDGTNASTGRDGATNKTDDTWINEGDSNCNNSLNVLCACW
ncbi:MAG: hypothetical protein JW807_06720 [Spirochaetes bacterium]|nr:hypothetical protein [Spirochaetota bacterium]